jgi:hypothetical protein
MAALAGPHLAMTNDHDQRLSEIEAEDAADLAEAERQIAMIKAARTAKDVPAILEAMEMALDPGDDPRLLEGVAALRRIFN